MLLESQNLCIPDELHKLFLQFYATQKAAKGWDCPCIAYIGPMRICEHVGPEQARKAV